MQTLFGHTVYKTLMVLESSGRAWQRKASLMVLQAAAEDGGEEECLINLADGLQLG